MKVWSIREKKFHNGSYNTSVEVERIISKTRPRVTLKPHQVLYEVIVSKGNVNDRA